MTPDVIQSSCEFCSPGKTTNVTTGTCDDCEVDEYSHPENGDLTCTPCDLGKIPNSIQSQCDSCPSGKEEVHSGSYCIPCEFGKDSKEGEFCTCVDGFYNRSDISASNVMADLVCKQGLWGSIGDTQESETSKYNDYTDETCASCDEACLNCDDGLKIQKDYGLVVDNISTGEVEMLHISFLNELKLDLYDETQIAFYIYPCPFTIDGGNETPCINDDEGKICSKGYTGMLCMICEHGWSRSSSTNPCTECIGVNEENRTMIQLGIAVAIVVILLLLKLVYKLQKQRITRAKTFWSHWSAMSRIIINLLQIVTALQVTLGSGTTKEVDGVLNVIQMPVNMDVLKAGCLIDYDFVEQYVIKIVALACYLILEHLICWVRVRGARAQVETLRKLDQESVESQESNKKDSTYYEQKGESLGIEMVSRTNFVQYLCFPSICQSAFLAVNCVSIIAYETGAKALYLASDYTIRCDDTDYDIFFVFNLFVFGLLVGGFLEYDKSVFF